MSNELKVKADHAKALIEGRRTQLLEVLPKHIEPNRMMRVFQNATTRNPKLLMCSDLSILTSLATCGAFGLEPNTPLGQCHIIPYGGQATFQMGYQGLIELARRAGTTIRVGKVCENDVFEMECGTEPKVIHRPCIKGERGEVLGFYAIAHPPTGMPLFEYMTKAECMAHGKKYSKAFTKSDSPWQTNPESMCVKTVVIRVCKYAPKSILAEWASVETREGINLDKISPASSLQDDDSVIDTTATEPEPGDIPKSLDDVAAEHLPEPPQDAQTATGKPSRSELNKMLLQARKAAKMTQEQLEDMARAEYGRAIGEMSDEAVGELIDLCNAQQN